MAVVSPVLGFVYYNTWKNIDGLHIDYAYTT